MVTIYYAPTDYIFVVSEKKSFVLGIFIETYYIKITLQMQCVQNQDAQSTLSNQSMHITNTLYPVTIAWLPW